MESYCFTFGCGSPLAKCYVEIEAPNEMTARLQMSAWFTQHWAGVYPKEGFQRQVNEYGLVRIPIHKDSCSVRLKTNHEELDPEIYHRLYGG